jgi:REP element-mobilizing transposase RayT
MSRKLRFVPPGGSLVEVTCRTLQGRFLLRPGRELNEIVVGVLGRAQQRYGVELVAVVVMSNHFHLLAWVPDALVLARFMGYLDGNLSREVGRLYDWPQTIWGRRYEAILVSDEEEAQVARLEYLLALGTKESLVRRPEDWPGVHCARNLRNGTALEGLWFNRTREYAARRNRKKINKYSYAESVSMEFAKLPCWAHLSDHEYQARIVDLLDGLAEKSACERSTRGRRLPSTSTCQKRICRQHPHSRLDQAAEKRAAPAFHAHRNRVRRLLRRAYADFLSAFRTAAEQLRNGDRTVRFPPGSFPPGLPFVPQARAP